MCGIAGVVLLRSRSTDVGLLLRMSQAIRHRGPDDEGFLFGDASSGAYWISGGPDTPEAVFAAGLPYTPRRADLAVAEGGYDLGLVSRRLAILDLSAAGHQPMANESQTLWITYNGEVYNYKEIRSELKSTGHRFFSESDTEVVLHAYEQWGPACLHRFNGMWAFALWDRGNRRLFCARDRFGVKPFYYFWDGSTFVFASQIKAILASGLVQARPYEPAIYDYLLYGLVDHEPTTCFEGIKQLPPGHYLTLDLSRGTLQITKWYELPAGPERRDRLADKEYVQQFYELFRDAVRLRLVSDVPVGTCLSGGLDSSSIVCMVDRIMREEGAKLGGLDQQHTFSARYEDPAHDEGPFIEAVVAKTQVRAHAVYPTGDELVRDLQMLVRVQDQPFGSTSIYAQWRVFQLARESGVTVTLDGQGGDEILAGYHSYYAPYLASLLRSVQVASFGRELYAWHALHGYPLLKGMGATARALLPPAWKTMVRKSLTQVARHGVGALWKGARSLGLKDAADGQVLPSDAFSCALYFGIKRGLPALLRYEDHNSMAHGIESRTPFLDYRLVELALQTPHRLKIRHGVTKILLREAMRGILPEKVRTRVDKVGFSTPEAEWFRGPMVQVIADVFRSSSFRARPYFDCNQVEQVFRAHVERKRNASNLIWRWLNLELWLRQYID